MRRLLSSLLRALRLVDSKVAALRRKLLPPELVAFEDLTAAWLTSALGTAAALKLPELVGRGTSLEALVAQTRVDADGLRRILDVLVSHGYFRWVDGGQALEQTRLSRALQPGRIGRFCELQSRAWYRDCFSVESVLEGLRSKEPPFCSSADGLAFFEVLQRDLEKDTLFAEAMAEITDYCSTFLLNSLHFEDGERVLDVGGGNGHLCKILADRFPGSSFTALDIHAASSNDGVGHHQGNFLEGVPRGYDHFLLKNILHDWDDDIALRILENCEKAAHEGTRLTLIEVVLPEPGEDATGSAGDFKVHWNVYCTLGGRERCLSEYRRLLERAGWVLEWARPTALPLWVLQASLGPKA